MTKSKAVFYMALAVATIAVSAAVRLYTDTFNVHDYSSLRTAVPELVEFSEKTLADTLPHAFAFRTMPREDGSLGLSFNSGYCLLAHRMQQGIKPTPEDKLVSEAVVRIIHEPWFRQQTLEEVERLKAMVPDDVEVSPETRAEMLRLFVESIRANPKFDVQLRQHLTQTAEDWGWPLEWK